MIDSTRVTGVRHNIVYQDTHSAYQDQKDAKNPGLFKSYLTYDDVPELRPSPPATIIGWLMLSIPKPKETIFIMVVFPIDLN